MLEKWIILGSDRNVVGVCLIVRNRESANADDIDHAAGSRARKRVTKYSKRYFAFRIAAILLGLSPFLILEIVLSCVGWEQTDNVKDPYVGFTAIRPLFARSEDGSAYEIAEYRKPLFCAESFPVSKSPDEFRIFCLGGSTVQGRPFAIETSFSTWLEQSLNVADAKRQWNVINCGGVSYASYRLAPIMDELLNYQPDLIVLYTGHNEFLEDRTYETIKSTPWLLAIHERLSSVKTYSFLRSLAVGQESESRTGDVLSEEVEARLDFKNGLEKYTRDDAWKSDVVQHFEHNLRRMLNAAGDARVPVILCNPVANLRDASPFKSENQNGLSISDLAFFEQEWNAVQADKYDRAEELKILEKLVLLNSQHAGLHYRIGQQYQLAGEFEKAKHHLVEAKEQDVCPLRIVEPMYDVIKNIRAEFEPVFVDVKAEFEENALDRIPGRELLLDHVHPSIHGHQVIAELLFEEVIQINKVQLPDDFDAVKAERFQSHLSQLPHMYFQLGKDRLAGLKRWAEGKVTREE